jgi:hypothetical protein
MQRAVYTLLDAGKLITQANLAREIGIRRQNVWKFFRCHPGFLAWLAQAMEAEHQHLVAPLARRHWLLGMQGSVSSAEFFMKVQSGYFVRELPATGPAAINNGFVINNLIPRPPEIPLPAGADGGPLRLPPPDATPVLDLQATLPASGAPVPVSARYCP